MVPLHGSSQPGNTDPSDCMQLALRQPCESVFVDLMNGLARMHTCCAVGAAGGGGDA